MKRSSKSAPAPTTAFTLGRAAFGKISEVEGIRLSPSMDAEFRDYDRRGLSAEERRRLIGRKYAKVR